MDKLKTTRKYKVEVLKIRPSKITLEANLFSGENLPKTRSG